MKIINCDNEKLVEIWLTNAESQDAALRESLTPLYKENEQKKYRVVVFTSGKGDMQMLTRDLLKHTVEMNARREVEAECCR